MNKKWRKFPVSLNAEIAPHACVALHDVYLIDAESFIRSSSINDGMLLGPELCWTIYRLSRSFDWQGFEPERCFEIKLEIGKLGQFSFNKKEKFLHLNALQSYGTPRILLFNHVIAEQVLKIRQWGRRQGSWQKCWDKQLQRSSWLLIFDLTIYKNLNADSVRRPISLMKIASSL